MSGGLETFALKEEDAAKLLVCQTHIGSSNCDFQMEQYVWKRRVDGMILPTGFYRVVYLHCSKMQIHWF